MESLTFDGYTSYSDASTPRTPSPGELHFPNHSKHSVLDMDRNIFINNHDDDNASPIPVDAAYWPTPSHNSHPFSFNNTSNNSTRGSLLQELYEESQALSPEYHSPQSDSPFQPSENWQHQMHQQSQHHPRPTEYQVMRRATFPYVRHDREDMQMPYPPFMPAHHQTQQHHLHRPESNLHSYSRQEHSYSDHTEKFIPSMNNSPHSSYHDFDETSNIKLEDSTPHMVPSQTTFYRSPSSGNGHPMSYLSPHTGLPVQHTDDAASKETQYLRRRCFNCHTTEPPSWRRSTLNPGKIVCNKCGLYERTHLRPRPLRFDELRAGNKARKQSKGVSPKQTKMSVGGIVKKEPREYGLIRRDSVSSSSSVHSGSGASDWDDNVSLYSSGSAPPTSFNSPAISSYPLSRDSHSPPQDHRIRLPANPLSDIVSIHSRSPQQSTTPLIPPPAPRRSHHSPAFYSPSLVAGSPQDIHQGYSPQQQKGAPSNGEGAIWMPEPVEKGDSVPTSS